MSRDIDGRGAHIISVRKFEFVSYGVEYRSRQQKCRAMKRSFRNFSSLYLLHLAVHVQDLFVMAAVATEAFM